MTYWEPEGFHRLEEGGLSEKSVDAVFRRMRQATGTSSQMDLAGWLCVRQACLSDARRRNIMPARWLRLVELETGYPASWLLTGQWSKMKGLS